MTGNNYKYAAMLCYIGAFMGPFGGNVVNILIPRLQKEFATSFYNVSLSITIYMIAFASFQLVSGLVADLIGRRNIVLFGYSGFGIGCIMCYMAPNMSMFLAGRFMQGFSNAFMTPVLMALLGDIVPKESLGKYMGVFGSVQTSGIFLAPILGGIFAELNWRYVFLVLALLAFILTVIYYKSFNYTSRIVKSKLIPYKVFTQLIGNKGILLLSLSSFAGYFGFGSLGFLFAKYIYIKIGVSESINGIMVSLTGLASIIFSPLAGKTADKYNRVIVCITGIAFVVPLIFIIPYISNALMLSFVLFVMGSFSAFVWSSLNTLAVDTLPEIRGTASSVVNSFKYFSFSLSPVAYGLTYQKYGMKSTFALASGITLIQLLIMILYNQNQRKTKAN